MLRSSPAVLVLLILNATAFLAGLAIPQGSEWLVTHGAFWFTENPHFGFWQCVTYMFLHGGIGHIFFNMFALVSFGLVLERQWGSWRFLVFYFVCGIGAALIHDAVNLYHFGALQNQLAAKGLDPEAIRTLLEAGHGPIPPGAEIKTTLIELYKIYAVPMLGASGAIYGILVAFGVLYPNAKLALMFIPVPVAAKIVIPILLALDLLSGFTGFSLFGGGIAHFAHLGGALIGFVLMLFWRRRAQPQFPR